MGARRLTSDAAAAGLARVVVRGPAGRTVVRVGRRSGEVATVLLHGAAGTWTTWTPLLATAARRGAPLEDAVVPDLPGWGESTGASEHLDVLADRVAEAVRALGYERWRIIGHSLGGALALEIAARHPDETLSVGLVSPSGAAVQAVAQHPVRSAPRLPWFAGMILAMRLLRALGAFASPLLRALRRSGLLRRLARPLFAEPERVHRSVTDALADEIRPTAFLAAVAAARGLDPAVWRSIRCPVHAVRGAHDVFVGRGDLVALRAHVPQTGESVLARAGHFAHVEDPEAVLAALSGVIPRPRTLALSL
ncbi:alpha/beta fold hydrolase [Microbacterium sp. NPDC091313]